MLKLKTSDAKKKGVTAAWAVMISMAIVMGGSVVAWRRGGGETSEGLWLACLFLSFLFCFVLFRFVVYRWTAVNDKRLRDCYLKWASAIPLVRSYETQKRQASKRKRRRRSSAKTWGTFLLQLPATDQENLLFGWVWNAVPHSSGI